MRGLAFEELGEDNGDNLSWEEELHRPKEMS